MTAHLQGLDGHLDINRLVVTIEFSGCRHGHCANKDELSILREGSFPR